MIQPATQTPHKSEKIDQPSAQGSAAGPGFAQLLTRKLELALNFEPLAPEAPAQAPPAPRKDRAPALGADKAQDVRTDPPRKADARTEDEASAVQTAPEPSPDAEPATTTHPVASAEPASTAHPAPLVQPAPAAEIQGEIQVKPLPTDPLGLIARAAPHAVAQPAAEPAAGRGSSASPRARGFQSPGSQADPSEPGPVSGAASGSPVDPDQPAGVVASSAREPRGFWMHTDAPAAGPSFATDSTPPPAAGPAAQHSAAQGPHATGPQTPAAQTQASQAAGSASVAAGPGTPAAPAAALSPEGAKLMKELGPTGTGAANTSGGAGGSISDRIEGTRRALRQGGSTHVQTAAEGDEAVEAQVAKGLAAAFRQRGGTVTLRLNPEVLGPLKIQVRVEDGLVWARFEPATQQAHDLLTRGGESLKQAVESRGLAVDRIEIARPSAAAEPGRSENAGHKPGDREQGQAGHGQDGGHPRHQFTHDRHEPRGQADVARAPGHSRASGTGPDPAELDDGEPLVPAQGLLRLSVNTVA